MGQSLGACGAAECMSGHAPMRVLQQLLHSFAAMSACGTAALNGLQQLASPPSKLPYPPSLLSPAHLIAPMQDMVRGEGAGQ